ncbi:hypothetical protein [Paenibacillus kribbensis]|uniref:hypothetical protein n=1 Tax=Paenibacillus kribbensis TaxID=172713 RepID=UPI00351CD5C8
MLEKENHQDIDYMISSDKLQEKFKIQICMYRFKTFLISLLVVIHPIVFFGFILLANLLLRKFL